MIPIKCEEGFRSESYRRYSAIPNMNIRKYEGLPMKIWHTWYRLKRNSARMAISNNIMAHTLDMVRYDDHEHLLIWIFSRYKLKVEPQTTKIV